MGTARLAKVSGHLVPSTIGVSRDVTVPELRHFLLGSDLLAKSAR
jgi:hypothetical protein